MSSAKERTGYLVQALLLSVARICTDCVIKLMRFALVACLSTSKAVDKKRGAQFKNKSSSRRHTNIEYDLMRIRILICKKIKRVHLSTVFFFCFFLAFSKEAGMCKQSFPL